MSDRWRATTQLLVCLVGVIIFCWIGWNARERQLAETPLLPLTFAHEDHIKQSCITCHHNYVDDNDLRSCLDCHKQELEVRDDMEAMFHTLCRDCHIKKALHGEDSGPVRACSGCHVADARP